MRTNVRFSLTRAIPLLLGSTCGFGLSHGLSAAEVVVPAGTTLQIPAVVHGWRADRNAQLPAITSGDPDKCAAMQQELRKRMPELDAEQAALESGLAELNRLSASLDEEFAALSRDQATQNAAITEFNQRQAELDARKKEVDQAVARGATSKDDVTRINAMITAANGDVARLNSRMDELRQIDDSLHRRIDAHNGAVTAAKQQAAQFNERNEAYNERTDRYGQDEDRYRADCTAKRKPVKK